MPAWEHVGFMPEVLAAVMRFQATASMGNVCRAWRCCVQDAADRLGDELGRREFPMACLAGWLSHSDETIERRVDRVLDGDGAFGRPIIVDELGRWWYKLAMCLQLARHNASRRSMLKMLLDRAVGHPPLVHHPYAYRRHFFDMFMEVPDDWRPWRLPMLAHRVRDLGCARLGKSINEVVRSTALCMSMPRSRYTIHDEDEPTMSYCPIHCGCLEADLAEDDGDVAEDDFDEGDL